MLGIALASYQGYPISHWRVWLVICGALAAHIAVNSLNEYQDFCSGLDLQTSRTPFSGGSGALPDNPHMAHNVLMLSMFSVLLCVAIGIYLSLQTNWLLLPVGFVGLMVVVTYTKWLNQRPWACLFSPGASFGLLMMTGSYLVFSKGITGQVLAIGLIPFFLINNLLLLNQLPDIEADRQAGRRTLPIDKGVKFAVTIYFLFNVMACGVLMLLVMAGWLPGLSLIALLGFIPAGIATTVGAKWGGQIGEHPAYLAANVLAALLVPALLAGSLLY
ncbi:hypothetical protein GCM10027098_09130 [Bowmanella dokdonensis]